MNPMYRVWWRFLMDLRSTVRYLAERFPKVAPWGVRLRSVLHLAIGNPIQAVGLLDCVLLWRAYDIEFRWLGVGFAVLCAVVEIYHRLAFRSGGVLVGWREAWRLRRRWPGDWAAVAAKTSRVQAEVGTSKEPIASAVLRPIADHPKLSCLPRVEWPVVSWWVGPPPGRSLAALDELATVLAANISHVSDVVVDYERENDSHGRLIMTFDDVLSRPSSPSWGNRKVELAPVDDLPDDGFDAAIQELDEVEAVYPPLRVIEGEAG
jgi:hypothetical protein